MAKKDEIAEIKCEVANVWTSNGKIKKGETDIVPMDEARALEKANQVSLVKAAK